MNHEIIENEDSGIDLRILLGDILGVVRRRWPLAIVLVLLCSGFLCFRANRNYRPMYRASATFTVYVTNPLQSEVRGYNAATAEQMAKTFPYILTSGALKDMVKRDLGLPGLPAISASVLSNTNIFTLNVTAPDPQMAQDVLSSVIRHYPDVAEFVVGPTVMNLLDETGVPTEPYNDRIYTGAIKKGTLIGAAVWAALVILMSMARTTVHNEDELSRVINVHCVGTLPRVRWNRKNEQQGCPMLDDSKDNFSFTESIRLMRIRLEREMQKRNSKALLVSSATPSEGKTTVAINLAKSLAGKGKKTLLIDCDLRSPSISKNLNLTADAGLAEYLRGEIEAEKAVKQINPAELFFMPAGREQEYAAELLGRPASRTLIEQCREVFDYIILDTPPSSLLTDAADLAFVADAALLVIRQNFASQSKIMDGAQALSDTGLPLIGCVLNCTTRGVLNGRSGYYGDRYGYSYGDYSHYSGRTVRQKTDRV